MKNILSALAITISLAAAPAIAADAPKTAPTPAQNVAPNPNDPKVIEARKNAFLAQEKEWNAKSKA